MSGALFLSVASEINIAHAHAIQHADKAIGFARQAGDLLLKVKASLSHGHFLPWVEAHCTVSPRQAQRYMSAAQGKPTPLRAIKPEVIKNDTVSHLADKPEIVIPLGSVGYVEWNDPQRNLMIFEVHSFLFPDGETLGIRTFYGMSGPSDNSGLYCEYDRRGINAAFCSVRDKAKAHHVPLEKFSVYKGSPTYWDSMHEMDLMDAAKAVQS